MLWCQAGSLPGLWKVVSGLEGLQRVVHGPAEQSVPSTGMGRAGRVTKSLCGGFGLSLPRLQQGFDGCKSVTEKRNPAEPRPC